MSPYLFFRKMHRLLVLVTAFSTLVMAISGIFLKFSGLAKALSLNLSSIRFIHNIASPFYTILLMLMMISGVVMYFYPIIKRKS
jgi:hypothetical protein